MVSFAKKARDWGVIEATTDEWVSIKSLINHVANPDVFDNCELDVMSGLEQKDWQQWVNKFASYDEPPKVIARSELCVLFATAYDAYDAKVPGLTDEHKEVIQEILQHRMSEALEFD